MGVVPKMMLSCFVWYIGTTFVAFTQEMHRMIFRCLIVIVISKVDTVFFHSFMSSSKKDWVCRAQVVQIRNRFLRYGTAWPGELFKLILAIGLVLLSYFLFSDEFRLRTLCWECAR